jgi:hypothetical protein
LNPASISDTTIKVIIGCDCDQDREDYGGTRYDSRDRPLIWDGLRTTLHETQTITERILRDTGITVRFTLNIRVDEQVEASHGEPAWVIRTLREALRNAEQNGHEIAWHPHLWRWSDTAESWIQEQDDRDWIWDRLHTWHKAFVDAWGEGPRSVHGGWMFQNNTSMQALDDVGIAVEYSALPGMAIPGRPTRDGSLYCGACDWSTSPRHEYYPSRQDYRIGPRRPDDSTALGLLEIPTFTFCSSLIHILRALSNVTRLRGRRRWHSIFEESAGHVFVNAVSSPFFFRRSFLAFLREYTAFPIFVAYFHADELLPERCTSYRRHLYNGQNLATNIRFMIDTARQAGISLEFIRAQDAVTCMQTDRPSV